MSNNQSNFDPRAPKNTSERELGFKYNQKMVNWFSPTELVRAGVQATISAVFGNYADKREIQALQNTQYCVVEDLGNCENVFRYSQQEEISIDYIADLGDGWNSTYTMASLLAEQTLALSTDSNCDLHQTERGSILIMGGDQVYPTASKKEYRNRLWGPYECALPRLEENQTSPDLFAIPGNHDWYDGLTSFSRLFFQNRKIGAWQTRQKRSYFAIQLPHGWWLWGIDTQLNADLDLPQINFFNEVAATMPKGSQIITCLPEPEWILSQSGYQGPVAYDNLHYIESKIIEPAGHHHTVSLAGDLHAYTRYESKDGEKQRIMAGGGGAYLHATHKFPNKLKLPKEDPTTGKLEELHLSKKKNGDPSLYPSRNKSRILALGALLFPLKAKAFSCIFGISYIIIAWFILASSISLKASNIVAQDLLSPPTGINPSAWIYIERMITATLHSPIAVLSVILFFSLCYLFTQTKNRILRIGLSVVHASAHLLTLQLLVLGFALINKHHLDPDLHKFYFILLFAGYMLILGSLASGLIIGLYIYLAHFFGHTFENEVLGCQSIENYKNFLRLKIDKQGTLTIYPIAVDKVAKGWQLKESPTIGSPYFKPHGDSIPSRAHLIEEPIVIAKKGHQPEPIDYV